MRVNMPQFPRSFVERALGLLERVEYRRAETETDLDAVLRLRYDAFYKEGAIPFNESGRLEDGFDHGDNVYNFAVFIDGELASALRLHVLLRSGQNSPALDTFGEFLLPQLNAGKAILDPNRFVVDYAIARRYPELPLMTLRLAYMAGIFFSADFITMTVRAEHQAFYRRNLFAKVVCPPRPYPLITKPISLLVIDLVKDVARLMERHPYAASTEAERGALFGSGPTCACDGRRSGSTAASSHAPSESVKLGALEPTQPGVAETFADYLSKAAAAY